MQSSSNFGDDQILPIDMLSDLAAMSSHKMKNEQVISSPTQKTKKDTPLLRQGIGQCALHVINLKADKTYDFRVAGINSNGVSEFGKPSRRCRTLKPLQPDKVIHLDPCEVYSNALVLQWTPPINNGADIDSYTIEQVRKHFVIVPFFLYLTFNLISNTH